METTAVFDSLRVNLKYNYVHGVNTAQLHGVRVRRLVDDLDSQQEYFANDTSSVSRILYAQDFFNYHITEDVDGAQIVDLDTALTIKMLDNFGEEMLTKIVEDDELYEQMYETYRSVMLSKSRSIGPRMMALLAARLIIEGRTANEEEEAIFTIPPEARRHIGQRDLPRRAPRLR